MKNKILSQIALLTLLFGAISNSAYTGTTRMDNATVAGSAAIGQAADANSKSVLELVSTTKGFLPPRMTTTQRDAITSPPEGMVIANTTTHTIDWYNASQWRQIASLAGTETLTNKTLSGNTATNLVNGSGTFNFNSSGTITAPNATDTLVGKATTDTLTNKTLSGNTATNLISGSGTFTFNTSGTVTAPNATDTLVGKATTDVLTNKSLSTSTSKWVDNTDNTKVAKWSLSGATTAKTLTLSSSHSNDRTISFPDATTTVVGTDATQTLSNKTFSGSTTFPGTSSIDGSGNAIFGGTLNASGATRIGTTGSADASSILDLVSTTKGLLPPRLTGAQRDLVSSPTEGLIIHNSTTHAPNFYNGTAWSAVGSGSGSGGINYITGDSTDLEGSVGSWLAYADAAGTSPVDGTGGSPTLTCTRTTSSPLRGSGSLLITKDAANRQGNGCAVGFSIDSADKGKALTVSFDYSVASGTYDAGTSTTDPDITAWVYGPTDGTAVVTQLTPFRVLGGTSGTQLKFSGRFQTAASGVAYRLILHEAKTGTSAYTLAVDNIQVGPSSISYGPAVSDWTAYTPTLTTSGGGSITLNATAQTAPNGYWRRVGDNVEIVASFRNGSGGSASGTAGTVQIGLPSGLTIDTAKLESAVAGGPVLGVATSSAASSSNIVLYNNTTTVRVEDNSGNVLAVSNLAASYGIVVRAIAPITGWSSNVQMSQDADTRVVAAAYTGGTTTLVNNATTTIIPTTKVVDTHAAYDTGTGLFTVPVAGQYRVTCVFAGAASQTPASSAKRTSYALIFKNGSAVRYGPEAISFQGTAATTAEGYVSGIVDAVAGNTLNCAGFQNLGANGAVNNSAETSANFERLSGPAQVAASETVVASYGGLTNSGSVSSGTPDTVKYPTKRVDTHGIMDTSTGIATINSPGIYEVTVTVGGVMTATSAAMSCYVNVNGSDVAGGQVTGGATITSREQICKTPPYTARFVAGDTIKGRAKDGTAGSTYSDGISQSSIVIKRIGL
jgi:hypothetical protein